MYIVNGICYANNPTNVIAIEKVKPLEDMMMLLYFKSGEVRLFDATILKGSAFEPLKNEAVFNTATVDDGVVTQLDGDIDCAPEYMYENSYAYDTVSGL